MKVEIIKGHHGKPAVRISLLDGRTDEMHCDDMKQAITYANGFQDGYNAARDILGKVSRWSWTREVNDLQEAERAAAKGNPNPPFVVDGHEFDDEDSNLAGDGNYPPFYIFDTARQQNLPGSYSKRENAQFIADKLNEASMAGIIPRPIALALFKRSDLSRADLGDGRLHEGEVVQLAREFIQALGSLRTDYTQEELVDDYLESI